MGNSKNFFEKSYFKNTNRTMETCFLCLKLKKEVVSCISVKSKQWSEHNIKNIIEKHLWPMVSLGKSPYKQHFSIHKTIIILGKH